MKKPLPERPRIVALSTLTPAQRRLILAMVAAAQEAAERRDAKAAEGAA